MNSYMPKIWQPRRDKSFLERYNLLRLNHEERENLHKIITRKETEARNQKPSTKISPELDGFRSEFYQTVGVEWMSVLSKQLKRRKQS